GLDNEQRAQVRLDLGRGLIRLGEPRAAAEAFLWLADFTTPWADDRVPTMGACEFAQALPAARLWGQMHAAVERVLSSEAAAADPAPICRMLRSCADALIQDKSTQRVGEALEYLRRGDRINTAAEESEHRHRWPETAQNAQLRAQGLAQVGRNDEALAAIETSIMAWQDGGDGVLAQLAEATRIAGVIEGFRLGRKAAARDRLAPIGIRCRAAGLSKQADQLAQLIRALRDKGTS